jgi:hypothetical protein
MTVLAPDALIESDAGPLVVAPDVAAADARKFGTFRAANPTISIVNAAEKILGK